MLNDQRSRFYVTVFVASLGMGMNMYFIPVFAQSFGATFVDLGLIGTVWALATTITPFLMGYLAGKMKCVWVYVLSLTLNAFATLFLVLSRSVVDIIVLRFFGGIGMEAFWVTAEIMVTDLAPAEARGERDGSIWCRFSVGSLDWPVDRRGNNSKSWLRQSLHNFNRCNCGFHRTSSGLAGFRL